MSKNKVLLGFDIGGTKSAVILGAVAESNRPCILERQTFLMRECPEPATCLSRLTEYGAAMLRDHAFDKDDLAAGISCGGPLDSAAGLILSPPNLPGWDCVPVIDTIQNALGIRARLQNDANAGALAEWHWGSAAGTQTAIFLTFGTGLGAGLIINGQLHVGQNDLAGEVGHWRMAPDGPTGYNKRGSFEGFCSGSGLMQLAAQHANSVETTLSFGVSALALAARDGKSEALEIFEISGRQLGRGLAMLIDLLNPEVIVLGSVFARCEELLRPAMERELHREALPLALQHCRIRPAALGEAIGDYAALAVAMDMA